MSEEIIKSPSVEKVLDTSENLIQRMEEFARKMEKAEILLCDEHQLEFADFEERCPACQREIREVEMESCTTK